MTDHAVHPALRVVAYLVSGIALVASLLVVTAGMAVLTYLALVRLGWTPAGPLVTGAAAVAWLWFAVGTLIPAGLRVSRGKAPE